MSVPGPNVALEVQRKARAWLDRSAREAQGTVRGKKRTTATKKPGKRS